MHFLCFISTLSICCVIDVLKDTTVYFVLIMVCRSYFLLEWKSVFRSSARLHMYSTSMEKMLCSAIPFFSFGLAVFMSTIIGQLAYSEDSVDFLYWHELLSYFTFQLLFLSSGFVRVLENMESPGILFLHFPGLEPGKKATGPGKFWKSVKLN